AVPAATQEQKQQPEWTWKDGNGKVRSRADLDEILKQHKLWLTSGKKSGVRADLGGAHLSRADLRDADMEGADLSGATLIGAHLSEAGLRACDFFVRFSRGCRL